MSFRFKSGDQVFMTQQPDNEELGNPPYLTKGTVVKTSTHPDAYLVRWDDWYEGHGPDDRNYYVLEEYVEADA